MTDTTQPPAETLAEAREAAALAFDARARKASHPEVVTLERYHAKVIRAGEGDEYDAVQAALIALTRRAGGDAIPAGEGLTRPGKIDPCEYCFGVTRHDADCRALTRRAGVTLYRAIDALGGTGEGVRWEGYTEALTDVLKILKDHGFKE